MVLGRARVLIATWGDARLRRRESKPPRRGSASLHLLGLLPREALAEVLLLLFSEPRE